MLKLHDHAKLQNSILKCDLCKIPFNDYCKPKFLPCFKTICTTCEMNIHKEAINKQFKCSVCEKYHFIPDDGFALNEKIYELITAEPMEISRGESYERLLDNLNKVESIINIISYDCENGEDKIKEHCDEQIRKIQLSTEKTIEKINKFNEDLIAFVKEYEKMCIQSYSKNNKSLKEEINKIVQEANTFINEIQAYLKQYQIDDEEIKEFNKKSEDLHFTLNEKLRKIKCLTFDNRIIKFLSNKKEINKFELGNFDYEHLREPSVFILLIIEKNLYLKIFISESIQWIK
jgi:hypothetical protein